MSLLSQGRRASSGPWGADHFTLAPSVQVLWPTCQDPTNPHNVLVQISSAHSLFIEPAPSTHCRLVEGTFMQRKSYLPLDRSRPVSQGMTWPAKCTPEFTNPSTFCLCSVHKPYNHIWQACPWLPPTVRFSSVAQLCLTLWPHGLQQARSPYASPTPGVYSNSCPLSGWCHPTTSSSIVPFSSHLQSFPASGSFPRSQFFASRGPKYWSFSFSISPSNEYSGLTSFEMDWLDLLAVQGTLKSLLQHHSSKASTSNPKVWLASIGPLHLTS